MLLLIGQLAVFSVIFLGPPVRLPGDIATVEMWGTMMTGARDLLRTRPWVSYAPAVALGLTIMGFQLLAEGVRKVWAQR